MQTRGLRRNLSRLAESIVEAARENGLNPLAYLCYLFERLPAID